MPGKHYLQLILFSLICLIFVCPKLTLASSESIKKFDVEMVASQNGRLNITENISYDFGDTAHHGIFRDIPTVSKVGDLYRVVDLNVISIKRDGLSEKFTTSKIGDNIEYKIGNPSKTISGVHEYSINYTASNAIGSNYDDHDEIYWNVTGNNWPVSIESAKFSLTTDFSVTPTKGICFTGPIGATEKNCTIQPAPFNPITITQPLNSYEGFTIVMGYPVNTFPKSLLSKSPPNAIDDARPLITLYMVFLAIINAIVAPIILILFLRRRHPSNFGKVSVNFDIPKDARGQRVPPAEAGIIDNTTLDKDDVTATIFDLAIRKYLKLHDQTTKKSFLGIDRSNTEHQIEKLSKSPNDLNEYERILYDRLFEKSDLINPSTLKTDFYITFGKLEKSVFRSLLDKGLFITNPKIVKTLLFIVGMLSLLSLNLILMVVLFFISFSYNGRTNAGDKINWSVDGLKIFLKNMGREYNFQAKNLITVEQYIPYAMALGLMDEFMKELKIVFPNYSPTWYNGTGFYNNFGGYYTSIGSSMTTSAPSSSSGFSGGGGSGGGGGGGGGGSW